MRRIKNIDIYKRSKKGEIKSQELEVKKVKNREKLKVDKSKVYNFLSNHHNLTTIDKKKEAKPLNNQLFG
jgi:hypothetical protein